jgi:hypothetical protein
MSYALAPQFASTAGRIIEDLEEGKFEESGQS